MLVPEGDPSGIRDTFLMEPCTVGGQTFHSCVFFTESTLKCLKRTSGLPCLLARITHFLGRLPGGRGTPI